MSLPKIHVVHEYGDDFRPHSTTFIRLIRPLTHPRLTAHLNTSFDLRYQDQSADLVIVEFEHLYLYSLTDGEDTCYQVS